MTERRHGDARLHGPQSRVLERYEVVRLIFAGGFGAVYQARDLQAEGGVVALKQLLSDPRASAEETAWRIARFEKEARLLAELNHPGIPDVLNQFRVDESYYLVMDYVDGDSLESLLQHTGPLPANEVLGYAMQICDVLEYLHCRVPPVVHRDVKPSNIIRVAGSDRVMLVDFGLARGLASQGQKSMVGTLGYAPMEQVQGKPEPRSDLYALGVTMHHLLSGQLPVPLHLPPLESMCPGLSHEVAAAVASATRADLKSRFASAAHMRRSLHRALGLLQDPPTPHPVLPPDRNRGFLSRFLPRRGGQAD